MMPLHQVPASSVRDNVFVKWALGNKQIDSGG